MNSEASQILTKGEIIRLKVLILLINENLFSFKRFKGLKSSKMNQLNSLNPF